MAPLRGWGPRCKRLLAYAPYKRWKTITFIAALRHDRIEAPWVVDGPINGEAFKVYVETQLLKTLKPSDIVVADNLGSHKNKAVGASSSVMPARTCSFCLPIAQISIRSNRSLPKPNTSCAGPWREPSRPPRSASPKF